MKKLIIRALTEHGKNIIKKNHDGRSWTEKMQFKIAGIILKVEQEEPFIFTMTFTNPLVQKALLPAALMNEIEEQMTRQGAENKKDYEMEAEE